MLIMTIFFASVFGATTKERVFGDYCSAIHSDVYIVYNIKNLKTTLQYHTLLMRAHQQE